MQQNPESTSLEMYIEQFLQDVNDKVFAVSKIQILTKTVLLKRNKLLQRCNRPYRLLHFPHGLTFRCG